MQVVPKHQPKPLALEEMLKELSMELKLKGLES
jgi:hypothetical protein